MTAATGTRPIVRPRFLKRSIVAFAVLLPIAAHALWDYVEARRLKAAVQAITVKGELTSLHGTEPYPLVGEAAEADRYYRAAAALATRNPNDWKTRLDQRVAAAAASGVWAPELVAEMRARVAGRETALQLIDHASSLPFEGFSGGTSYGYRAAQMLDLLALDGVRTFLAALDGDGDRGAESLYAEARLQRALEHSGEMLNRSSLRLVQELSLLAERTRPSGGVLAHLADALAAIDQDDTLKRQLVRERAFLLDRMFADALAYYQGMPRYDRVDVRQVLFRPWIAHRVNESLEAFAAAIQVADEAWPARIDAIVRKSKRPAASTGGFFLGPSLDAEFGAKRLSLLRCARVVVAVTRYQVDRNGQVPEHLGDLVPGYLESLPVDPFSGRELRFTMEKTGYEVYSVGPPARGNAGQGSRSPTLTGTNTENLGIRIRTRKNSP